MKKMLALNLFDTLNTAQKRSIFEAICYINNSYEGNKYAG